MKIFRHRALYSLCLSGLLLIQTLPTLAQEAATAEGSFDLRLEEALALQGTNRFPGLPAGSGSFQVASLTNDGARPEARSVATAWRA